MPEVGLIITGEDKATAMMGSIGKSGKASLEGIRGAASKAGEAFAMLGKATVVFNQALELGRKALDTFRILVGDTIRTALDFRKLGDPAIEAFKNMERQALVLRARLGDILIPLAQGLHDAFVGVGNGVVEWINANRKLIATNIATWMADIARLAIDGVAFGVLQISRAWSGWQQIILSTQTVAEKFFSLFIEGIAATQDMYAGFIGFFSEGMAAALRQTADEGRALAATFTESSAEHRTALDAEIAKQDELEKKLLEYKGIAVDFIGEAELAMLERIRTSRIGGIKTIEEQTSALVELGEAQKEQEVRLTNMQQLWAQYAAASGTALGEVAASQENAAESGKKLAISMMQATLAAASTEAAAKAIAAHSGIPFVGVAIGLSFAAAAVAAIMSYATTKFDTGGVFRTGGGSGQATLHDKERVLDVRQTQTFDHLVYDVLPRLIGARTAGAGAGGVQVNNWDMRSFIPRRGVEMQRAVIEVNKTQKKLQRRGRLKR